MPETPVVVVGGGHNGLVAAAAAHNIISITRIPAEPDLAGAGLTAQP